MAGTGIENTNILDVSIDKERMNPGDTARLSFELPSVKDIADQDIYLSVNGGAYYLEDNGGRGRFSRLTAGISDSIEGEYLVIGNSDKDRRAYYKVYADEIKDARNLTLQIRYINTSFSGTFGAALDVYYKGAPSKTAYSCPPDISKEIILTYSETESTVSVPVRAEQEIDFIIVTLSATALDGVVKVASPQLLRSSGENLVEPFNVTAPVSEFPRWIGENLSKIERNLFIVRVNGSMVFYGEKFDSGLRDNAYEIALKADALIEGSNNVDITYVSVYPSQRCIALGGAKVVMTPKDGIVGASKYAGIGKYPVAVKLRDSSAVISGECDKPGVSLDKSSLLNLHEGLNIILFDVGAPFEGRARISLKINATSYRVTISRFLEKADDVLYKSASDTLGSSEKELTERAAERIYRQGTGNLVELNNSYCNTGGYTDESELERLLDLFALSGHKFMVGRGGSSLGESQTNNIQIPCGSGNFIGFIAKDMDKAFSEQSAKPDRKEAFYYEMLSLKLSKSGEIPLRSLVRNGGDYRYYFDTSDLKGMADAGAAFTEHLALAAKDAYIHIGSGMNFDALAKAGFRILIDVMDDYGDIAFSALRGTCKVYDGLRCGVRITPPDPCYTGKSVKNYRRYLTELYLGYMKGSDLITVSGNIGGKYYAGNRAVSNIRAIEREFSTFIATHTRRGCHYTGFGFIKGINEDLRINQRGNVYGAHGKYWRVSNAEKSWDLLGELYKGFGTGGMKKLRKVCIGNAFCATPYSDVDIIPFNDTEKPFDRYKYLVCLGGNTCNETLAAKWLEFAENGGTLLLALPHLYTTDNRTQAIEHKSHILLNEDIRKLIGIDEIRRDGGVSIGSAQAVGAKFGVSNDKVFYNKVAEGKVYFVNEYAYPYAVKRLYGRLIRKVVKEYAQSESDKGFLTTSGRVSTSLYDADDRRTLYMLDVRCGSKLRHFQRVKVSFAGRKYYVKIVRDVLNILTIFSDTAILSADNTTDIISYTDGRVTLQGEGNVSLAILKGGHTRYIEIELRGITEISI